MGRNRRSLRRRRGRCRRRARRALPRQRTGTPPARVRWYLGGQAVPLPSPKAVTEGKRVRECLLLLPVKTQELEPRHLCGVLDLRAVTIQSFEAARRNGDVA